MCTCASELLGNSTECIFTIIIPVLTLNILVETMNQRYIEKQESPLLIAFKNKKIATVNIMSKHLYVDLTTRKQISKMNYI